MLTLFLMGFHNKSLSCINNNNISQTLFFILFYDQLNQNCISQTD